MKIAYEKQGFCGDKTFGFCWNETDRAEDDSFFFGDFNIFVNNTKILNGEFVYDINIALWQLKQSLLSIKSNVITNSDSSKEDLYMSAYRYRKYWTYIEDEKYKDLTKGLEWDDPKVDEILEEIDNELNSYEKECSFGGIELDLYYEITDQGWHFFLFQNKEKTKDRLIYSNDNGKTVYEVQLELGTVERVLSELPDL